MLTLDDYDGLEDFRRAGLWLCADPRAWQAAARDGKMSETFLDGRVTMLCGDVRAMLATIPENSIDCVITSPPYYGLRCYGTDPQIWDGDADCAHEWGEEIIARTTDSPPSESSTLCGNGGPKLHRERPQVGSSFCRHCGAWRGELGLEPYLGLHLQHLVDVFAAVHRVLKPTGVLFLNYGDCYATSPNGRSAADTKAAGNDDRTFRDKPFSTIGAIYDPDGGLKGGGARGHNKGGAQGIANGRVVAGGYLKAKDLCMVPNRLAIALQDFGWWVRSEIVWGKVNPMPDSSGKYRPSTAHEKIFMLTKTANSFYDAEAVARPCSTSTHARVSQDVANQVGSARANGGAKTNGNMKAVTRWKGSTFDGNRALPGKDSMESALVLMQETRYLRNYEPAPLEVWPMATHAFSEAHFATFPPELAERAIKAGTSEKGCCAKCGAPWMRETSRIDKGWDGSKYGARAVAASGGALTGGTAKSTLGSGNGKLVGQRETLGWSPSCACNAATVPCTVLDPFAGSGTVAMVAIALGRTATLIELNPEYCTLARARIEAAFMGKDAGARHMAKSMNRVASPGPLFE